MQHNKRIIIRKINIHIMRRRIRQNTKNTTNNKYTKTRIVIGKYNNKTNKKNKKKTKTTTNMKKQNGDI